MPDTYTHEGYKEDPIASLPASIRFQRKLNQIQSEAILAVEREALARKPEDRNIVLGSAIDLGVSRLAQLEIECPSKLGGYTTLL